MLVAPGVMSDVANGMNIKTQLHITQAATVDLVETLISASSWSMVDTVAGGTF